MAAQQTSTFEEEVTNSFQELRKSLGALISACGMRPSQPQQMARQLSISRNLTWKVSKVLCAHDLFEAMQHLPGDEGVEIVIRAAGDKGIDGVLAKDVRDSLAAFNRVVDVHSGDRATLELMLDNWGGNGSSDRLEQSRKLAFRGNCGIWGVQTRVRAQINFVAPCATDNNLLDLVMVLGMVGFRRLRPGIRWPLFRPRTYHDDGTPLAHGPDEESIDPAFANAQGPKLISDFCSKNMPAISLVKEAGEWTYELSDGPIGNTGAFDCFFGSFIRGSVNRYAAPGDEHGEASSTISLPVEWLQCDLLIHRDLDISGPLESIMLGQFGHAQPGGSTMRIPFDDKPMEMHGRPPVLASSLVDRYGDLMEYIFARMNWSPSDFRAYRLLVHYPPMHSSVVIRFGLPSRP